MTFMLDVIYLCDLYYKGVVMLVLSRQRNETIKIGDEISITVVDIRGDKVRIGIEAPKNVIVHRQEVYDEIQKDKNNQS